VRGYLRSPYASQFADAFIAGVITLSATIDRDAVVAVAAMMEPEQEKVIYLRIARRAAIDGLIDFAAFAASHAEGVENDPRAELYSSLSNVTSGTIKNVLDKLSKIDRSLLSENDRQLLDAASAIAAEMTVPPVGLEIAEAEPASAAVRNVGPEPVVTAAQNETQPADHGQPPSPAEPTLPAARSRSPGKSVDATVEQAAATVASVRAKLTAIDKLLGNMPE